VLGEEGEERGEESTTQRGEGREYFSNEKIKMWEKKECLEQWFEGE